MSEYNEQEVRSVIVTGLEAGYDDDVIRMEMFKAGVPFNKINALFKEVAIEGGFRADPKLVREEIEEALDGVDYSALETWDDVLAVVENILEQVSDATAGQVVSLMRREARALELELPRKPKAAARGRGASKIKALLVEKFRANPEITATELLHAVIGEVTGEFRVRNTIEYVNMYLPVMVAIHKGVALSEVQLEGFDKPALEAQYGGTTSYTKSDSDDMDDDSDDSDDDADMI